MKDDLAMGARRMAETYAHLTHLSALLGECADKIERLLAEKREYEEKVQFTFDVLAVTHPHQAAYTRATLDKLLALAPTDAQGDRDG